VLKGHAHVVQLLVELGANKDSKGENGRTALHFAAALGLEALVQLLVTTLKLDKTIKDNDGKIALEIARERYAS
jgi:ankyrin repeat protein